MRLLFQRIKLLLLFQRLHGVGVFLAATLDAEALEELPGVGIVLLPVGLGSGKGDAGDEETHEQRRRIWWLQVLFDDQLLACPEKSAEVEARLQGQDEREALAFVVHGCAAFRGFMVSFEQRVRNG